MKYFLSLAMSLAVFQLSIGDDRCWEREYQAHPTDCDKYLQCLYNTEGVLENQERPCPFPTFWNPGLLACAAPENTPCPFDKCQNQPSEYRYKGEGNCRGYWQCAGGKSVPMCCPQGQHYNETRGCVENDVDDVDECLDACFDAVSMPVNETKSDNETVAKVCESEAVPNEPTMYALRVPGRVDPIYMHCAPGTAFSQDKCQCSKEIPVQVLKECKREVYLPFDQDEKDQSGQNVHIKQEKVVFQNGKAYFNGYDSKLIIPRFNNVGNIKTIVIKVNYTSSSASRSMARAIISNGYNCTSRPTVLLSEDDVNVYFGVGTTNVSFSYTYFERFDMSQTGMPQQKKIVYKYDGAELTGTNGYNKTQIEVGGSLLQTQCPFTVGLSEGLAPFEGSIDELEIYLCDPDM